MSVGRICSRVVATAYPVESVRGAARRMAENDVGTLVVVDPRRDEQAIGVVTDRDIAIRCVAADLDPDKTSISRVMTTPVQSVAQFTAIEDAAALMAKNGVRRLVVTDSAGCCVGVVSLDDILGLLVEEAGSIGRLLGQQESHVVA